MSGVNRLHLAFRWLRQTSWQAKLATVVLAISAGLLIVSRRSLTAGRQTALWGLWLLLFAVCSRRLWQRLLGPVFFYDMLRNARQGRSFFLRVLYAAALLVVLFLFYSAWLPIHAGWKVFLQGAIRYDEAARFAENFFLTFLLLQFMVVFLLAPVYAASSLTEEKERRTLGFLLATHLDSSEIVLGKFASRLLTLLMILATGLPILSFLQLMGGVDPQLVLAGFAATFVTAISLGALGVLNSAYAMRPRGAVISTYLEAAAYLGFSLVCGLGGLFSGSRLDPLYWIGAGNIVIASGKVVRAAATGTIATTVFPVLADYVVFHLLAATACIVWAVVKLRVWNQEDRLHSRRETAAVAIKFPNGELVTVTPESSVLLTPRPPLGENPLLWKELYVERGMAVHPVLQGGTIFVTTLALFIAGLVFLIGILLTMQSAAKSPTSLGSMNKFSNLWLRMVGTPLACLAILGVAIRAATGVSRERYHNTLDSLLATPLEIHDILWAKWWGSILSARVGWWCLLVIWLLTICTGGLNPFALPLLVAACGVYAAFTASVGLWFSVRSSSTLRATIGSLLTIFAAATALGVLGQAFHGRMDPSWNIFLGLVRWLDAFQRYGLCIPYALDFLVKQKDTSSGVFPEAPWAVVLAGLVWYAGGAFVLWKSALARFARMAGREPISPTEVVRKRSLSTGESAHLNSVR